MYILAFITFTVVFARERGFKALAARCAAGGSGGNRSWKGGRGSTGPQQQQAGGLLRGGALGRKGSEILEQHRPFGFGFWPASEKLVAGSSWLVASGWWVARG